MKYKEDMWLGGSDIAAEGEWGWTDGRQISTTYWMTSDYQPNNYGGNQDCLSIKCEKDSCEKYQWYDDPCTAKHKYLCKMRGKLLNNH